MAGLDRRLRRGDEPPRPARYAPATRMGAPVPDGGRLVGDVKPEKDLSGVDGASEEPFVPSLPRRSPAERLQRLPRRTRVVRVRPLVVFGYRVVNRVERTTFARRRREELDHSRSPQAGTGASADPLRRIGGRL